MQDGKTITKLHNVFEGRFHTGHLASVGGRHSDGFVCYLSGGAEYIHDGFSFSVEAGGVFYLARGSRYSIRVYEDTHYVCVDFDFAEPPEPNCLFSSGMPDTRADFRRMLHTWAKKEPGREPRVMGILYGIYAAELTAAARPYQQTRRIFSEAASYMLEHLSDPELKVEEIAGAVSVSQVHLRRVFRAATGETPVGYMTNLRLERARNMLIHSNFSVSEVALSVGISDPFYFSRLFRAAYGLSPGAYKKTNRILV